MKIRHSNVVIKVKSDEEISDSLSRFKKKVKNSGVLVEVVERMYFLRPAEKKKLKSKKARQRRNSRQQNYNVRTYVKPE